MKKIYFKKYAAILTILILSVSLIITPTTISKNVNSFSSNLKKKSKVGGAPPTVIEFDGPSSININETATFYIKGIDPDYDRIMFLIDWKIYYWQEFNLEEYTSYYDSGQTIQITHTFNTGGTYNIAVIARDVNGEQSEVLIHEFNVNGGYFKINYTYSWTNPAKFIPNQAITLCSSVKNFGNRDFYKSKTVMPMVYLDGNPLFLFRIGPCLIEAGEEISGGNTWCRWPDNYNEHEIKFSFSEFLISNFLYKSATENLPPETPEKPDGPLIGKVNQGFYTFVEIPNDPCEHDLYILADWGDGNDSGWVGPFKSGDDEEILKHTYSKIGNYEIKVKAKDIHDAESGWSDSLTIIITRNRQRNKALNTPYLNLLQNYPTIYQLFQRLLKI